MGDPESTAKLATCLYILAGTTVREFLLKLLVRENKSVELPIIAKNKNIS